MCWIRSCGACRKQGSSVSSMLCPPKQASFRRGLRRRSIFSTRDRSASNPVLSLPRRTSVVSKKSYQSPASRTPPPSAFCQTLPPSQATTPTGVPRLACTERKSGPSSNHPYVSPTPQLARHSLVKMLHGNATSSTTTSHVGDNNASFVSAIPRSPFAAAWGARRATFTPTSA
jgi:hypothetical protein